ncbi:MAG TPA: acyl-CoA dehydrogenase family protein [Pseudogracilibacillus sp.]|nr:acyl-CoA dehydrogenase family protein [Pseudogracilibacillus sp.]
MNLTELKTKKERLELIEETAKPFKERAYQHDIDNSFPFENFEDLKAIGYPLLTVPETHGGLGISLVEMLQAQETIAKYDGSTALSIGWHMGISKNLGENKVWDPAVYDAVAADIVTNGALLNNAATEPATGSPTRGGRPETFAVETEAGWVINGRKSFTTLSPILDYFVVSASIDGTEDVASFLIRRGLDGVAIDETWDSVGMKATGSHDLVLTDVKVKKEDLVQYITPGNKAAQGWLLHIPACYLGIAKAAQREALQFATTYAPNNMKGTIADFPTVRQRIGEISLRLLEMETLLYAVAQKWDENDHDARQALKAELGAAKLSVVNKAVEVVDLAMRIVGARSLSAKNPLQRYYRDVRAGLNNPPMDDMTIMAMATESIEEFSAE